MGGSFCGAVALERCPPLRPRGGRKRAGVSGVTGSFCDEKQSAKETPKPSPGELCSPGEGNATRVVPSFSRIETPFCSATLCRMRLLFFVLGDLPPRWLLVRVIKYYFGFVSVTQESRPGLGNGPAGFEPSARRAVTRRHTVSSIRRRRQTAPPGGDIIPARPAQNRRCAH